MTGVVLLYVGVVLIVNGIWLIGQARAAAAAARMPAMETAAVGSTVRGGGYAGEAAAGQELGGEAVAVPPPRGAEANPLFIQNREVAILNIFTGFIGLVIAITFIVGGGLDSIRPAVCGVSEVLRRHQMDGSRFRRHKRRAGFKLTLPSYAGRSSECRSA
jgi:hypothetical protein